MPNLLIKFIHSIKLLGLALFLKISFFATPWSGDTLKYFSPNVTFIASNLKIVKSICQIFNKIDPSFNYLNLISFNSLDIFLVISIELEAIK